MYYKGIMTTMEESKLHIFIDTSYEFLLKYLTYTSFKINFQILIFYFKYGEFYPLDKYFKTKYVKLDFIILSIIFAVISEYFHIKK